MKQFVLTIATMFAVTTSAQSVEIKDEMLIIQDSIIITKGQTLVIGEPSQENGHAYITEQLGFTKAITDIKDSQLGKYGVKSNKSALAGEEVRVMKWKRKGNKRRGYKFTLIVALANRTFKIVVPQAFNKKEVLQSEE